MTLGPAMTWRIVPWIGIVLWIGIVILGPLAFCWWWASLVLMILRRTRSGSRRIAAICIVPALGMWGILLAVLYAILGGLTIGVFVTPLVRAY